MILLVQNGGPAFENSAVVLLIIIVVLFASLGLFAEFFLHGGVRDRIQCHFATELLAIVVTAFTSFLAVATGAVSQNFSKAEGNFGVLTISLIGPAAVWAGARALLKWASPFDSMVDHDLNIEESIRTSEERLGWVDYKEWKRKIGRFSDEIEVSESHFIDDLLPKVFYHGHKTTRRLLDPQIRTLFVYRGDKIIKLQRIQGEYDGSGARPQLYLQSTSSTDGGKALSVHAFQERGEIADVNCHGNGEWVQTKSNAIDCLVCTIYENDSMGVGDYLYVDTTKYVESDPRAYVELCIVSDKVACNVVFWDLRASLSTSRDPVPLIFREVGREAMKGKSAAQEACEGFEEWIALLARWRNKQMPQDGLAPRHDRSDGRLLVIDGLWAILGLEPTLLGSDWAGRITSDEFKFANLFWNRRQESVLLTTFEWENHADLIHSAEVESRESPIRTAR